MIALDPEQLCTFTSEGATFVAKYMTARQWIQFRQLLDAAHAATEAEAITNKLLEALAIVKLDMPTLPANLPEGDPTPVKFGISMLPEWLTPRELWGLVYDTIQALELSEEKKRRSASQCESSTDSNAATATVAA